MNLCIRTGDIFESEAQTLVNTINTVGVMGKGIALQFKNRFPDMFDDYVVRCNKGQVELGKPYLFKRLTPPWILNFPTKDHWRSVADFNQIIAGLEYLLKHYESWGIESIAVPPLGCGLGGLDWEVVGPAICRKLSLMTIPVELFAPHGTPNGQLDLDYLLSIGNPRIDNESRVANKIPPSWVALVKILETVNSQKYHWPIGRTTFEKMAYFASVSGIETGLTFDKRSFGPHSDDYSRMRSKLIQNGLLNEVRSGKMMIQTVGEGFNFSSEKNDNSSRWSQQIDRVADLFTRIQTTRDAELAASSHYASVQLKISLGRLPTELEVFEYVKDWKSKRREGPYEDYVIAEAIRNLAVLGWIGVIGSEELPIAA